jgi:hypothetical protein
VLPAELAWVREHVAPSGPAEVTHERPWATVARVPVADGQIWFKRCAPVQAFEPQLTSSLASRWPCLLPEVIGSDPSRGWLLLGDAGVPVRDLGNPPEKWLEVLPAYAEVQIGEAAQVGEHLAAGVSDLRLETVLRRYDELLSSDVPLCDDERARVAGFAATFATWCAELASYHVPASIQHDDLHHSNLYLRDGERRIIDWGDALISHPFASLIVTFRFLQEFNGLRPDDPWFGRLRDAYLEPWGAARAAAFDLAFRVGTFAPAIAWIRQRRALPDSYKPRFDTAYRAVLDRMLALVVAWS